ncbi:hexulose-6-phosphate synthase, partial [Escherichia coli]|nr:hexulose-6-phosphate synthase [Escherichia coli]
MRTKVQALRKKQKNTLDQIVKTPVPQGIKWSDIESLVKALGGEIKEGRGSRCKFILNMS